MRNLLTTVSVIAVLTTGSLHAGQARADGGLTIALGFATLALIGTAAENSHHHGHNQVYYVTPAHPHHYPQPRHRARSHKRHQGHAHRAHRGHRRSHKHAKRHY